MDITSLTSIFDQPIENGIVTFVIGILFVLSIYHFVLYFQQKEAVYLYYSLYTFTILVVNLNISSGFIEQLIKPLATILKYLELPLLWLYNSVYFIFAITFVNLKRYSKKWYLFINRTIISLIILIGLIIIIGLFYHDYNKLFSSVRTFIVPFLFLFALISYYPLLIIKMPFKNYILLGSLVLFITSFFGFYLHPLGLIHKDSNIQISIFYMGVIIENIIFSLGLGNKQKHILLEKNDSQKKLILQLKENDKLKLKIQEKLEEAIVSYSKQAEIEKFKKLKAEYDKELVELKISSLRSQMNPHFIFNSLNAIKLYIIDNEKENAVYYLNKFSKLIRKILAVTREKENTLSEEIETLKLYLEIENIRFHNEIKTEFIMDKKLSLDTIKIPSLILQPFIENAIWHGLSSKKGIKKIKLSFEKEKDSHLIITIIDNGIGRKKSAAIKKKKIHKKESIGIKITEERLKSFTKDYKNNYSLNFTDLFNEAKAIGTQVILKIPIK